MDDLDATIDQGFSFAEPVTVAVRGERLALTRMVTRTSTGDESARLSVNELDADGRMVRSVLFDENDLVAALAELDRAYYFGESAAGQRVLRVVGRYAATSVAGDLDEIRAHLADDFVVVDHQRLGFGAGDREYFVDMRRLAEPDENVNTVLRVNEHALLTVYLSGPVTADGTRYERSGCLVMGIDASDRVNRIEMYADDDFEVALARFEALGASTGAAPSPSPTENATTRLMQQSVEVATARRFDRLRELLADDFVRADHRTGVSAPVANGPDEFVTAYAAWFEVGFDRLSISPIAVRGDQLALARLAWSSVDGRTVDFLGVYETNADGRFVRGAHYDEGDLDTALAELDGGFSPVKVPIISRCSRPVRRGSRRAGTRIWTRCVPITSPDLVCVDHQPLGFGTLDRDGLLAATQLRFELSADDLVIVRSVQVAGDAVLAVHYAETATESGSRYEREGCYLLTVDGAGLLDRWEVFGDGEYDRALARLHELGNGGPAVSVPGIQNTATRRMAKSLALQRQRRFEDVRDLYREDFVRDDRRAITGEGVVAGRDAMMENIRTIYELDTEIVRDALAIRGDHLMLARMEFRIPGGFELVTIDVIGGDDEGRAAFQVMFDEDQLDAALAELDERWIAGEGAEHEYMVRRLGDFRAAQSRRDWAAIEALVAEDFAFVDHRPIGLPETDRAGYVAVMRASDEQTPGARMIQRTLDVRGDIVLSRTGRVGSTPDGFEYEWEQIAVMVWAAGLLRGVEFFSVTDAASRARREELTEQAHDTPSVDNRLVRFVERARWLGRYSDVDRRCWPRTACWTTVAPVSMRAR